MFWPETTEGLVLPNLLLLGQARFFFQACFGYVATQMQLLCSLHVEGKGISPAQAGCTLSHCSPPSGGWKALCIDVSR